MSTAVRSLGSGLAGSLALTAIHQLARDRVADAPRMDVVGMRALLRLFESAGARPPAAGQLYDWTLAGDIGANTAYYSLVATGSREHVWQRGAVLGLLAGAGALLLPRRLGLGDPPHSEEKSNWAMTIGWYLAGGLAAAAVASAWPDEPALDAGRSGRGALTAGEAENEAAGLDGEPGPISQR